MTAIKLHEGRQIPRRASSVNLNSTGNDHLPVYDSLVRERGDVVAEARSVAETALYQAAYALSGHGGVRPAPGPAERPAGAEGRAGGA
ncbi:hypothetical protein ACFWVU_34870 [Streptomyces sp. NPDC058686]|uniref:hypothetical protein n=1 Tax=Streptomyces sp. NPDC058686 TaxID=3346599 RepID=UPI0036503C5D